MLFADFSKENASSEVDMLNKTCNNLHNERGYRVQQCLPCIISSSNLAVGPILSPAGGPAPRSDQSHRKCRGPRKPQAYRGFCLVPLMDLNTCLVTQGQSLTHQTQRLGTRGGQQGGRGHRKPIRGWVRWRSPSRDRI